MRTVRRIKYRQNLGSTPEAKMTTPIYFTHGELIAKEGDIKIYKFENEYYLEKGPGHTLLAISDEIKEYRNQIESIPYGNCLEVGLGLGVASNLILSHDLVKSLTTIEKDQRVIKLYRKMNLIIDPDHVLVCADGLEYLIQCHNKFDFIFFDFYGTIDEDTIDDLGSMMSVVKGRKLLKKGGIAIGWIDPYTEDCMLQEFVKLFT